MPRHAAANQHLKERMPETRASISEVVQALTATGVQQQHIAQAAGWAPPYLSQFLTREAGDTGERIPGRKKLGDLIGTLNMLLSIHSPRSDQQRISLKNVADLYEVALSPISAPTNPIERTAPNFVDRSEEHTSELQSLRHLVCR